jgi:hypothetical protein
MGLVWSLFVLLTVLPVNGVRKKEDVEVISWRDVREERSPGTYKGIFLVMVGPVRFTKKSDNSRNIILFYIIGMHLLFWDIE